MKKLRYIFASVSAFLIVTVAEAATLGEAPGKLTEAGSKAGTTSVGNFGAIVGRAIAVALSMVGFIFLILTVYAGFLWMTARGDEEQIRKAQKIIMGAGIGLIIVVSAYAITVLVGGRF